MKHINPYLTFINENIRASEAYNDASSIQTIIDGKRELGYIALTTQKLLDPRESIEALKSAINSDLKLLPVKNRTDGVAFVVYRHDVEGAKKLAEFASSRGGYLSDQSAEEAEFIGKALGYAPEDIQDYIERVYGR